jgi:hypothetical protein
MAEGKEGGVGFFHHVPLDLGGVLLLRRDEQGEFAHLPPQFGDDPFGSGSADAGKRRESLGVLLLNHYGDVLHGAAHRPQGLLRPDSVDRAEHLKELPLHLGDKADELRRDAAAGRVPFHVMDGVQAHHVTQLRLQLAAAVFGNGNFIFKWLDGERGGIIRQTQQFAGDFGDQVSVASAVLLLK